MAGNGDGQRGRFRVEEHDDRLGAVLIKSSWALNDLWSQAVIEADRLLKA
jgi:hypothetical protein